MFDGTMSSTPVSSSAKTEPATSNVQIVNGDRNHSSTITTTAKSSVTTITASAKKSRKSESAANSTDGNSTNFLPIAPHQTFYSPNQGLTLASVQQQQLQSGSVALFSSPTMMATLGTGPQGTVQQPGGPQTGQQLVMAAPGQAMGPAFNTANGQGLIQAQGMGVLGVPPVQVIQTGGAGQPAYAFQPVYANPGMQQMILAPNLTMAFPQNHTQGLAIQIPGSNNTGTMITTNQIANTPTTPIKNQPQNQQIIKSVTISPQQPQATKSNASTTSAGRGQAQSNQQQTPTIIQQTFQSNTPNQAFVIGFQGATGSPVTGATILPSTSTSSRKSTVSDNNSAIISLDHTPNLIRHSFK